MTTERARAISEDRMAREAAAHLRGEEVPEDARLADAAHYVDPMLQSYDPRQEREPDPPAFLDQHVLDHEAQMESMMKPTREFREVMELAWCYRTGQLKTPSAGKAEQSCGIGGHCDRAKLAAEYLESTPGWGELLWPVVVAVGDGCLRRTLWGNRTPSWSTAHRLWVHFAPRLLRRLTSRPFAAFVEDKERDMAYAGGIDDLREESMRLAEIDKKYAVR